MPALLTRTSSLDDWLFIVSAAALMDSKEERSSGKKIMFASGDSFLRSAMASSALAWVRAPRKICCGWCFASCRTVSLPRPTFPAAEIELRHDWETRGSTYLR